MSTIKFYKVNALPDTLEGDAFYHVANGDYAEGYLTDSTGVAKAMGNSAMIQALIDTASQNITQGLSALLGIEVIENANGVAFRHPASGLQVCYRWLSRYVALDLNPADSSQGQVSPQFAFPAPFLAGATVAKSYTGYVTDGVGNPANISIHDRAWKAGVDQDAIPLAGWQAYHPFVMDFAGNVLQANQVFSVSMIAIGKYR